MYPVGISDIVYRDIHILQFLINPVVCDIADRGDDAVRRQQLFTLRRRNDNTLIVRFHYAGFGVHIDPVVGNQILQHEMIHMRQSTGSSQNFIRYFHNCDMAALLCQPDSCFTADKSAADDDNIATDVFLSQQHLVRARNWQRSFNLHMSRC